MQAVCLLQLLGLLTFVLCKRRDGKDLYSQEQTLGAICRL